MPPFGTRSAAVDSILVRRRNCAPVSRRIAEIWFPPGRRRSTSEGGSSFECDLDNAGWSSCPSPQTYNGLADGEHSFEVRAVDAVGNTDPTPASRSFSLDTTAPDTTIDAVEAALPRLLELGFKFETVSQMLASAD